MPAMVPCFIASPTMPSTWVSSDVSSDCASARLQRVREIRHTMKTRLAVCARTVITIGLSHFVRNVRENRNLSVAKPLDQLGQCGALAVHQDADAVDPRAHEQRDIDGAGHEHDGERE